MRLAGTLSTTATHFLSFLAAAMHVLNCAYRNSFFLIDMVFTDVVLFVVVACIGRCGFVVCGCLALCCVGSLASV